MPLPPLDSSGNLPVGDYIRDGSQCQIVATLRDIKDRFVDPYPRDPRRSMIWDGWMEHRRAFAKIGLQFRTLVDGSFTTAKIGPDDIDIAVIADGTKIDKLRGPVAANFERLFDVDYAKATYHCHPFLIPAYPFDSPKFRRMMDSHGYLTRVFGRDKVTNNYKAILLVEGTGVI